MENATPPDTETMETTTGATPTHSSRDTERKVPAAAAEAEAEDATPAESTLSEAETTETMQTNVSRDTGRKASTVQEVKEENVKLAETMPRRSYFLCVTPL